MLCVAKADLSVGPTASAYTLPSESCTDCTEPDALFQPTTTTFKFPAVCNREYVTDTVPGDDCGTAFAVCTNAMTAGPGVVEFATGEYGPVLLAASVARTR